MFARAFILLLVPFLFLSQPGTVAANERLVRLYAPDTLWDSGLMKFILPRFSLKTQVRVERAEDAATADLVLDSTGDEPLFEGLGEIWKMTVRRPDHPGTAKLADWLRSDIGQRTIASFAPEGQPLFGPPEATEAKPETAELGGQAKRGHAVSRAHCSRCHAVDEETRGWGIGSTPSFGVLRALPDWEGRFTAFFTLNPHPAFIQIKGFTDPFPIDRPSPIKSIELTIDDVNAVVDYVATLPPADLGKPLDHQ